jgi:hypothetical protein
MIRMKLRGWVALGLIILGVICLGIVGMDTQAGY